MDIPVRLTVGAALRLPVRVNTLLSLLSNIQIAAPVLSGQFGREHIHIFNLRWFC
jgi:hypothetical protein